jgi:hypothetical protein
MLKNVAEVWIMLTVVMHIFYHDAAALFGLSLLIIEDSRSHSDTPHSVRILWKSDQPDAENST